MKKLLLFLVFGMMMMVKPTIALSQTEDTTQYVKSKLYVVIKNDGTEFIGVIISQDAREVLIRTEKTGDIYIPKHEIREIKEITNPADVKGGVYIGENSFATRYFITTNGLSAKKGDHYAILNWWGPDVQFAVSDHFTLGAMTTWVGAPLIASVKFSHSFSEKFHVGLGVLGGTLSWANFGEGGGLAYGSVTFGSRKANISFSGGVLGITASSQANALFSVGALAKFGKKTSFVFDSFIFTIDQDVAVLAIPGLRFQSDQRKAFQFGLAAAFYEGYSAPIPIPFLGWFRKIGE